MGTSVCDVRITLSQQCVRPDHASAADHRRASSYPHVQFTAIVNPHNGPGEGLLPNEDYTQAIKTLNSMDNVRTIGYVATTWFRRSLNSVLDDVARYAGWGISDHSLAMSGIFFDETPTRYAPEYVSYLQTLSRVVRSHHGLKDGYIGKTFSFSHRHWAYPVVSQPGPNPTNLDIWPPLSISLASLPKYCGFACFVSRTRGSCCRQL
jgi:hypothetical protein